MKAGAVLQSQHLAVMPGIRHGFFTRKGGVSSGDYATLNVGIGSNDAQAQVAENRRRVAAHLNANVAGHPFPDIVTTYQVHSADVITVVEPFGWDHSSLSVRPQSPPEIPSAIPPQTRPKADALVTSTPGLAIGVLTADCTPILFADAEARVVAAAHAGWRGAVSGIIGNTVAAMERMGASRSRITAAVGPVIRQNAYEVGPEFKAQFLEQAPGNARFFKRPEGRERDYFDLPGYCCEQLTAAGVACIEDLGLCTYENESLFYSFRRKTHRGEADYGRQIAAIVVS